VWAFGVTLWEILSACREQPYSQFTDAQVVDNLQFMCTHSRLQVSAKIASTFNRNSLQTYLARPAYCSSPLYADLMLACWSHDEDARPTLQLLHRRLQQLCCSSTPHATNTLARCDFV
jgi:discoidin domain receptor family protein 2